MAIINDILDFSKIEAGKQDVEVLDFDIFQLIDDLVVFHSVRAADKQLAFRQNV